MELVLGSVCCLFHGNQIRYGGDRNRKVTYFYKFRSLPQPIKRIYAIGKRQKVNCP